MDQYPLSDLEIEPRNFVVEPVSPAISLRRIDRLAVNAVSQSNSQQDLIALINALAKEKSKNTGGPAGIVTKDLGSKILPTNVEAWEDFVLLNALTRLVKSITATNPSLRRSIPNQKPIG